MAWRVLLSGMLAVMLAVTSVTMAVARGQSAGLSDMVICSGYGVVTVSVDAQGRPVGPVHPCPDCLAGAQVALPGEPAVGPVGPSGAWQAVEVAEVVVPAARSAPKPSARGPPPAL